MFNYLTILTVIVIIIFFYGLMTHLLNNKDKSNNNSLESFEDSSNEDFKRNGLMMEEYRGYFDGKKTSGMTPENFKFFSKDKFRFRQSVSEINYSKSVRNYFSQKYSGIFKPTEDGVYQFKLRSDDASFLYIDDNKIIDNGNPHPPTNETGKLNVKANTEYKFEIYFGENTGGNIIKFDYEKPSGTDGVISDLSNEFYHEIVLKPGLRMEEFPGYYGGKVGENPLSLSWFNDKTPSSDKTVVVSTINYSKTERNDFTQIYSGIFKPTESGVYTFKLTSDDASYLLINDEIVVDNGDLHGNRTKNGNHTVVANKEYKFEIYFGERGGRETLILKYNKPNQTQDITDLSEEFFNAEKIGLIMHLPLNGSLDDISGNEINGAFIGGSPTYVEDYKGSQNGALSFDGSNNYINLSTYASALADFSHGFSFSGWVKWDATLKYSRIFDFGEGTSNNNILLCNKGTTKNLAFYVFKDNVRDYIEITNYITIGEWTHVGVTFNNTTKKVKIFKNGSLVPNNKDTLKYSIPNVPRTSSYIGKSNWDHDSYFKGQMSDFCIYKKELTESEVEKLYNKSLYGVENIQNAEMNLTVDNTKAEVNQKLQELKERLNSIINRLESEDNSNFMNTYYKSFFQSTDNLQTEIDTIISEIENLKKKMEMGGFSNNINNSMVEEIRSNIDKLEDASKYVRISISTNNIGNESQLNIAKFILGQVDITVDNNTSIANNNGPTSNSVANNTSVANNNVPTSDPVASNTSVANNNVSTSNSVANNASVVNNNIPDANNAATNQDNLNKNNEVDEAINEESKSEVLSDIALDQLLADASNSANEVQASLNEVKNMEEQLQNNNNNNPELVVDESQSFINTYYELFNSTQIETTNQKSWISDQYEKNIKKLKTNTDILKSDLEKIIFMKTLYQEDYLTQGNQNEDDKNKHIKTLERIEDKYTNLIKKSENQINKTINSDGNISSKPNNKMKKANIKNYKNVFKKPLGDKEKIREAESSHTNDSGGNYFNTREDVVPYDSSYLFRNMNHKGTLNFFGPNIIRKYNVHPSNKVE